MHPSPHLLFINEPRCYRLLALPAICALTRDSLKGPAPSPEKKGRRHSFLSEETSSNWILQQPPGDLRLTSQTREYPPAPGRGKSSSRGQNSPKCEGQILLSPDSPHHTAVNLNRPHEVLDCLLLVNLPRTSTATKN